MTSKVPRILLGLVLLALFSPQPGLAQSAKELKALRKDIETLKLGQRALFRELREIKALLQRGRAPRRAVQNVNVVLKIDDDPFKGEKNAKLTLVEFSDYQCPFCRRFASRTLPQIEKEYIKTGKVKYVFRDFPIAQLHPQAFKGHEAANCAGEQGRYWEMHGRFFANPRPLGPKDLQRHAQALGLDLTKFQRCLDSGKHAAEIREDMEEGRRAGVRGTPTFFLGYTEPNAQKLKALRMIRGAQPYFRFKQAIEGLLSSKTGAGQPTTPAPGRPPKPGEFLSR